MNGNKISGGFWFLFAVLIIREGVRLDIGSFHEPGPGFMSLLGGILLAVFSALLLLQSFLGKPRSTDGELRRGKENPWLLFFILIGLVIYVFIFEWLGFIISTFLLVTFLLRFLEHKKWWKILLTAGVISLSAFVIFNVLLKAGLPDGVLRVFP
jgi:putative tricarboxylic transport membrane protein